jgi:AcrR family transcriptional regulator
MNRRTRGEYAWQQMLGETPKRRGRPPSGGREAILEAALELLRERGIARLTTREIAAAAGVSEASIFYHYRDRAGLLTAVFAEGLKPLQALGDDLATRGEDLHELLERFGPVLEQFLDQALPVMTAAQSDTELRDALAAHMNEFDLGPHRGVINLGAVLAREQAAGRIRTDVDPEAVALLFVGACFIRASQRQMHIPSAQLPKLEDVTAALETMLRPN